MRNQFRNNKVELRIPRLPHPLHAVLTQQAVASGVQPPPTPAAPHIAPLPEGFELDPSVTSQLHQPASARGQAPKRPAPETPASPVFEGLPSGPLSPAPPSQFSTRSSDPPLTAFRTPQGRPRIAKPRMMKENGAKKRTAHTGSFRQQTQRARGDAKKTMLRNCLGYFKESMQS